MDWLDETFGPLPRWLTPKKYRWPRFKNSFGIKNYTKRRNHYRFMRQYRKAPKGQK